ncbi:hypothetical protein ACFWQ6_02725 [Streptomyces coelicoflavus]|uniref:hypothetical protein n=1 Tax=Streptomyces coelicoflavus TaxID=285562 RepID=UPI003666922A
MAEADLDLGCVVLTRDGAGTAAQPLGAQFGDLDAWPYVSLDQDDRTGESSDGETLRINIEHRHQFTKLLAYVYLYEGAADFRTLGGVITVSAPSGTWRLHLDDSLAGATSCAIALLTPRGGTRRSICGARSAGSPPRRCPGPATHRSCLRLRRRLGRGQATVVATSTCLHPKHANNALAVST